MINRERKNFLLKPLARKPKLTDRNISSTVLVRTLKEQGYCYFRFGEPFVQFVGKEMPRGVAPFEPCYLAVTEDTEGWLVEAVYVTDGVRSPLWRAVEKPAWVGELRKEKNRENNSDSQGKAGTGCS